MRTSGNSVTTVKNFSFKQEDKLGKGATGSVFRGVDNLTGNRVAIKVIDLKTINNEVTRYLLGNEKQALRTLNHPSIIKCVGIVEQGNNCYIVTEECQEGTLADYLKKRGKLNEDEATNILRKIVAGCKHYQEKGVVHRDLKPSNILMKGGQPKISDFGYCEVAGVKKPSMYYNVGSPSYMPPEAYIKNFYSEKSDVWAVGMIFYEMLKGATLDKGMQISEMYNFIRTGGRFIPAGINRLSERILTECLRFDFNKRVGFRELEQLMNVQPQQQSHQSHQPHQLPLKNTFEKVSVNHHRTEQARVPESKPQTVRPLNENLSLHQLLMKQSRPEQSQKQAVQRMVNVSNNRQIAKERRPFVDSLNLTDPCINQSMLSNDSHKVRPSENLRTQHTGPRGSTNLNDQRPQVIEKRYLGPQVASIPYPKRVSHADIPVLGARQLPPQTVNNTPRYARKQPDTITIYRNF